MYQLAVIGGGFFGCAVALHMRRRGFERILLIERESQLLSRASFRNQARVHNGCHYPRSYLTAYRSRFNLPRFQREYGFCVKTDFQMLYAVAAKRSKVTVPQFEHFMRGIGVTYEEAGTPYTSLFTPSQIAAVFLVDEYAFDARRLREHFSRELIAANVDVMLDTECVGMTACGFSEPLKLDLKTDSSRSYTESKMVFNCTYANLNRTVHGDEMTPLKHEIAEVALVDVPRQLTGIGITVMDGPFFSCMPFPSEQCHSLTHVRYTPHGSFIDQDGAHDLVRDLESRPPRSRVDYMMADAARLTPCLRLARWRHSLFEIKTVLARNEVDDGRPILLRQEALHPRLISILGAKIDNIYDVLERLDALLRGRALELELCGMDGCCDP